MKKKSDFIWSDGWYIEGKKAWFIGGEYNAIFELDTDSFQCRLLVEIPVENPYKFRMFSGCIRHENRIYCIPCQSHNIWIYDMSDKSFCKIDINEDSKEWLRLQYVGMYKGNLILFSRVISKLYFLNTSQLRLFEICDFYKELTEMIIDIIQVDNLIYGVAYDSGNIIEVNLDNIERHCYKIEDCAKKFKRILYIDGHFLLWGVIKEIGIWKKGDSTIDIINEFPDDFGIYEQDCNGEIVPNTEKETYETIAFDRVIFMGKVLWCIPLQTNHILLINKSEGNKIETFYIPEETERIAGSWEKFTGRMTFQIQGLLEERYLCLFSFKYNCVLKIDTQEQTYEYLDIPIDMSNMCEEDIYLESNMIHRLKYKDLLKGMHANDRRG